MEGELSKAERTRNFIIETTAGIFNTKGYAATSMSDITEATGLTKGSIYGNFENKEEVCLAVFDYNLGKVNKIIQQRMQSANTWFDKLMVYATVYDRFSSNAFPQGGCPILNTAIEADDTNVALKEKAAAAIVKWKKNVEEIIKKGIQAGEFKEITDPAQFALSMIALIEGGIMIAKVTNSQGSLDKILKTVEVLINQIKK
jgi:TetR/AcrR family transcriptional regulator, transcriptional repressor for nem operon